jgi:uncharacterized protein YbjQ (UPF0145 family)
LPYCKNCGKEIKPDVRYCPYCGTPEPAATITPTAVTPLIQAPDVIVTTTPAVPGYEVVKTLGLIHGLTVRTRGVGGKIVAGIEGVFGGEVTAYTSECEKARKESLERLVQNARNIGANAVIGVDFETSDVLAGTATIFAAYGTAVIVKPIGKQLN